MAIYGLSDLHLDLGVNKPMDIFGSRWDNYVERIKENWTSLVSDDDLVLVPGDISWATYLEDAVPDFEFVNSLPGRKLILKGNHDYYWTTKAKLDKFLEEHSFDTITFLSNDAYFYKNIAICGTRGWAKETPEKEKDDVKINNREVERLKLSLAAASKGEFDSMIVCTHYPLEYESPYWEALKGYPVTDIVYGHLHNTTPDGIYDFEKEGINFHLISADYLQFKPKLLVK